VDWTDESAEIVSWRLDCWTYTKVFQTLKSFNLDSIKVTNQTTTAKNFQLGMELTKEAKI